MNESFARRTVAAGLIVFSTIVRAAAIGPAFDPKEILVTKQVMQSSSDAAKRIPLLARAIISGPQTSSAIAEAIAQVGRMLSQGATTVAALGVRRSIFLIPNLNAPGDGRGHAVNLDDSLTPNFVHSHGRSRPFYTSPHFAADFQFLSGIPTALHDYLAQLADIDPAQFPNFFDASSLKQKGHEKNILCNQIVCSERDFAGQTVILTSQYRHAPSIKDVLLKAWTTRLDQLPLQFTDASTQKTIAGISGPSALSTYHGNSFVAAMSPDSIWEYSRGLVAMKPQPIRLRFYPNALASESRNLYTATSDNGKTMTIAHILDANGRVMKTEPIPDKFVKTMKGHSVLAHQTIPRGLAMAGKKVYLRYGNSILVYDPALNSGGGDWEKKFLVHLPLPFSGGAESKLVPLLSLWIDGPLLWMVDGLRSSISAYNLSDGAPHTHITTPVPLLGGLSVKTVGQTTIVLAAAVDGLFWFALP